jgi:type VI secretion system secreted protein Hcp
MAVDMFLSIKGVEGESADSAHPKEIDVLAWSWGLSQSGTAHVGGGAGSGKVSVQDISVTKYVDSASHRLMQAVLKGDHFEEAKLTVRKAGGDPLEYIVITMKKKVYVTGISTGGSGGEDRLTENVTLNFEEVNFAYKPQTEKGTGEAAKEVAWNIAQNAAA